MPRALRGRLGVLLIAAVFLWLGCGLQAPSRALAARAAGPFGVGVISSSFVDPSRGTPARIGVPAQAIRAIHELIYAPVDTPGLLSTVVFAPGWDNQSSNYDNLLRAVASAGYLVVGVDSPGSSSYCPGQPYDDSAGENLANNTIDLSAALQNVEAGPMGNQVDPLEVAAVGHSNGGSEVANLALNNAFVSRRFNAYVVLSGDVPFGLVPGSFAARNNGPIMAMVGTGDEYGNYTPQPGGGGTESVFATAASPKIMVTIAGATHLSAYIGEGSQSDDTRAAIIDFLNAAENRGSGSWSPVNADTSQDGLVAQQDLTTVVDMASTADGGGYWLVGADGGVFAFGDAGCDGSMAGHSLSAPIIAMADDPATRGYWLLGGDGGVFSFDAPFHGSTGNIRLVAPAVGMTATLDGKGYYFAAADGGVFTYGDARFDGSMGGHPLNKPVVGMAVDFQTGGYWLDASDGGIFSFNAPFEGSTGNIRLNQPCVAMAAQPLAPGYWLVAADGGIFNFGNAAFYGSGA